MLASRGSTRPTSEGEILFREGDPSCDFFVILDGLVAIVEGDDDEVISVHGRHRFLGELNVLTGQPVFVTAVVQAPGEVLVVPADRLKDIVTGDPALGDIILRAYLIRRSILIGAGTGLRILGSRYSSSTRRLRDLAARNRIPHRFVDLEEHAEADDLLKELGVPPEETPIVLWRGQVLRNPSSAELAGVIGLPARPPATAICDLLVVGAGPGGLAASVYGASEGLSTVTLEAVATGGQAATSSRIENYLGFPSGISGGDLAELALIQAQKFGAHVTVPAEASSLENHDGYYVVRLAEGEAVSTRALIVASGVRYRKLPVPGLDELEGSSVYYAATLMEAQLCAGTPVVVVGGGNSAGQAVIFLADHVGSITLIVRERDLSENMSAYLADRIERDPRVQVLLDTEVGELVGEKNLEAVVAENNTTGERRTVEAKALFVFIGAEPHASWLGDQIQLDDGGYVLTGSRVWSESSGHDPLFLETSLPGVFAAGDIRSGSIKRVASAVGEGAMAVRLVHERTGAQT
jgi:thioredoxin reductase (NADPH)